MVKTIKCICRTAVFITLLFATDSSVTAVEIGFYDSTPAGTVMIDSEGNQTFYEHSSSEEVANYYSSWADVLVTPVINILLYNLINSSLQTIGNNKLLDYSYYTFNVFGSVFYYRLWPKYSQLINLPSIISKVHYHYMIHTRHTYSPLLIHRIFDPSQSRLFYRFIPVSMPRFLDNPNQIGMHPSFWKLDSELRRRNVYIELYAGSHAKSDHDDRTAVGEGSDHELDDTDQSAETGEDRYGGRYLVMDIYPLHSQHNDRLLLNRIHFKSSHQFTWLEELIYEFEWQKQKGAWEEGYQPVSINDLIANHEFESPLSPEWISHIAKWLMERKDRDLFNLNTKISQIYHGGPIQKHSEQCDQQMKGCFHRKIDPALETNGCLSLDLHQSRYYLPADLINQNQSVTSGYCHAVLAEPNEQLITAEHKAFNSDESERMFVVNDLRKTVLSIAVSFGLKHVSKLFDVKNPPNPDKNRGSMILAVSRTPRVKEFPQTFPGIIKALDQSDASSGVNIQEPELDALEVHNKGDATTSKVDHEPDVDQVQEPAHGVLQGTRDQPIHDFVNQEEGSGESLFTDKSKISADSATEHTEVKLLAFVSSSYGESDTESAQGFSDQKKSKSSEVVGKEINTDSVLLDTQSDAMMDVIQKDLTSEAEGTGVTEEDKSVQQKQIEQMYKSDSKAGAELDVAKSESASLVSQSSDGEAESDDTRQVKRDDLNELVLVSSRDSVDTQSDEVQFDIPTSHTDPMQREMVQPAIDYTDDQKILHMELEPEIDIKIDTVSDKLDSMASLSSNVKAESKDFKQPVIDQTIEREELQPNQKYKRDTETKSADEIKNPLSVKSQGSSDKSEQDVVEGSMNDESLILSTNEFQVEEYYSSSSDDEKSTEPEPNSESEDSTEELVKFHRDFEYSYDELDSGMTKAPKLKVYDEPGFKVRNIRENNNYKTHSDIEDIEKFFSEERRKAVVAAVVSKLGWQFYARKVEMPKWSEVYRYVISELEKLELNGMTTFEIATLQRKYLKAQETFNSGLVTSSLDSARWLVLRSAAEKKASQRFRADYDKLLPKSMKRGNSERNVLGVLAVAMLSMQELHAEPLQDYVRFVGFAYQELPLFSSDEIRAFLQQYGGVVEEVRDVLQIKDINDCHLNMIFLGSFPGSSTVISKDIEAFYEQQKEENEISDKIIKRKREALEAIDLINRKQSTQFKALDSSKDSDAVTFRKEMEDHYMLEVAEYLIRSGVYELEFDVSDAEKVLKKIRENRLWSSKKMKFPKYLAKMLNKSVDSPEQYEELSSNINMLQALVEKINRIIKVYAHKTVRATDISLLLRVGLTDKALKKFQHSKAKYLASGDLEKGQLDIIASSIKEGITTWQEEAEQAMLSAYRMVLLGKGGHDFAWTDLPWFKKEDLSSKLPFDTNSWDPTDLIIARRLYLMFNVDAQADESKPLSLLGDLMSGENAKSAVRQNVANQFVLPLVKNKAIEGLNVHEAMNLPSKPSDNIRYSYWYHKALDRVHKQVYEEVVRVIQEMENALVTLRLQGHLKHEDELVLNHMALVRFTISNVLPWIEQAALVNNSYGEWSATELRTGQTTDSDPVEYKNLKYQAGELLKGYDFISKNREKVTEQKWKEVKAMESILNKIMKAEEKKPKANEQQSMQSARFRETQD